MLGRPDWDHLEMPGGGTVSTEGEGCRSPGGRPRRRFCFCKWRGCGGDGSMEAGNWLWPSPSREQLRGKAKKGDIFPFCIHMKQLKQCDAPWNQFLQFSSSSPQQWLNTALDKCSAWSDTATAFVRSEPTEPSLWCEFLVSAGTKQKALSGRVLASAVVPDYAGPHLSWQQHIPCQCL